MPGKITLILWTFLFVFVFAAGAYAGTYEHDSYCSPYVSPSTLDDDSEWCGAPGVKDFPPLKGYGCTSFPVRSPAVYADEIGPFSYGITVIPSKTDAGSGDTRILIAIPTRKAQLGKNYKITWTVEGGSLERQWGNHGEIAKIKISDSKNGCITAHIRPTNYRSVYYLRSHRP